MSPLTETGLRSAYGWSRMSIPSTWLLLMRSSHMYDPSCPELPVTSTFIAHSSGCHLCASVDFDLPSELDRLQSRLSDLERREGAVSGHEGLLALLSGRQEVVQLPPERFLLLQG